MASGLDCVECGSYVDIERLKEPRLCAACESGDACTADVLALVVEVRRLRAVLQVNIHDLNRGARLVNQRADRAEAEVARLTAHVEMLDFCLDQARILLQYFKDALPDPAHRRIAEGGLIASAPPGALRALQ